MPVKTLSKKLLKIFAKIYSKHLTTRINGVIMLAVKWLEC